MHHIGTGILTWEPGERRTGRYGSVLLLQSLKSPDKVELDQSCIGKHGSLVAKVFETRASSTTGDLLRQVFPVTPNVGELVLLGTGTLFFHEGSVGLGPTKVTEDPWLSVKALYRVHDQTVALYFREH